MKIYMAGGLFSTAEIDFNKKLAGFLRQVGHYVFLPQDIEWDHEGVDPLAIFKADVNGINWCELILANMDGPDQDSGTCWELGYAYAKHKHIMLYRTDIRRGKEAVNLMMTGGAHCIINEPLMEVRDLAQRISDEIATRWQPYRHGDK